MGIKTFKVGKVTIVGDTIGEVNSASLNITIDSGETTEIGDTWKGALPLGKSWNLSVSLYYNPDDTRQGAIRTEFIGGDGALSDVRMWEDDSVYFSGDVIITSFAVTKGIGAVDTLSITFEGDGALSYSG